MTIDESPYAESTISLDNEYIDDYERYEEERTRRVRKRETGEAPVINPMPLSGRGTNDDDEPGMSGYRYLANAVMLGYVTLLGFAMVKSSL